MINRWMVSRNVTRTLPMPHHSRKEKKERKNIRHKIFQAKIHYTTNVFKAIDDLTCALRVQNESKTTVSEKDKIKATNRE